MHHDPAGASSRPQEAGAGSDEAPTENVGDNDPESREVVLALKADTGFIQSMEVGAGQRLLLPDDTWPSTE